MTIEDVTDDTWESAALRAMMLAGCDNTKRNIKNSFRELYDAGMQDEMARKAMHELNRADPGSWTIRDQVDLLASKQHDYGHENVDRFGYQGVQVRLWDKVSRYENLTKRGLSGKNESVADTLKDIIGYCVICRMVLANTFRNPLAADIQEKA